MAEKVIGRNVVLYKYDAINEVDIPFACSTECTLVNNLELKEITSQSSANYREFKPDVGTWQITCSGFVVLNTQWNYLFQLNSIVNRDLILVKFVIDNGGIDGLSIFTGSGYIVNHNLSAPDTTASNYQLTIQGSGAPSLSGTTVTPGGIIITGGSIIQVFQAVATEGQSTFTFAGAIGLDLLYASRGGISIQPIGTLTGNGATWNAGTGTITLATPSVEGEQILILAQ